MLPESELYSTALLEYVGEPCSEAALPPMADSRAAAAAAAAFRADEAHIVGNAVEIRTPHYDKPFLATCIGRGGQAFVAASTVEGTPVAMKVFAKWNCHSIAVDDNHRRACHCESEALKRVSGRSPYIINLFGSTSIEVRVPLTHKASDPLLANCIVMDQCRCSLRIALTGMHHNWNKHGVRMQQRVATATVGLVELLHAAHTCHRNGIAHMDIKPDNILVGNGGVLRLADFGHAVGNPPGAHTAALGIVDVPKTTGHTARWAAPEVLAKVSPLDAAKADVWSIGCVYFQLVLGVHPRDNGDAAAALEKGDMDQFWRCHAATAAGAILHEAAAGSFITIAGAMLAADPVRRVSTRVLMGADWVKGATPEIHQSWHAELWQAATDGMELLARRELTGAASPRTTAKPSACGISVASVVPGAGASGPASIQIAVPQAAGAADFVAAGAAAAAAAAAGEVAAAPLGVHYVEVVEPSPGAAAARRLAGLPVDDVSRYAPRSEVRSAGAFPLLDELLPAAVLAASYTTLVRYDPEAFFGLVQSFAKTSDERATRRSGLPIEQYKADGHALLVQLFAREDGKKGVRVTIEAKEDGFEDLARAQGRELEAFVARRMI